MEYGYGLPQSAGYDLRTDIAKIAQGAEKAGYAGLWVYDRVLFPLRPADGMNGVPGLKWIPYYQECADPLTVLTAAAAVTDRIRLGTSVLLAPLRPPLLLARSLATLDRLSGGRLVAGFGSGWSTDEYRGAGADFRTRGAALDEAIDVCRAVWRDGPVTLRTSRADINDALVAPKPAGPIPIMLGGGKTPRAIDRIARKADGWLPSGLSLPGMAATWARIRESAERHGRDPADLRLVPRAAVVLTDAPQPNGRRTFMGTIEQVLTDVAAADAMGAAEMLLDLSPSAQDADQLLDRAFEMRDAISAAGL